MSHGDTNRTQLKRPCAEIPDHAPPSSPGGEFPGRLWTESREKEGMRLPPTDARSSDARNALPKTAMQGRVLKAAADAPSLRLPGIMELHKRQVMKKIEDIQPKPPPVHDINQLGMQRFLRQYGEGCPSASTPNIPLNPDTCSIRRRPTMPAPPPTLAQRLGGARRTLPDIRLPKDFGNMPSAPSRQANAQDFHLGSGDLVSFKRMELQAPPAASEYSKRQVMAEYAVSQRNFLPPRQEVKCDLGAKQDSPGFSTFKIGEADIAVPAYPLRNEAAKWRDFRSVKHHFAKNPGDIQELLKAQVTQYMDDQLQESRIENMSSADVLSRLFINE